MLKAVKVLYVYVQNKRTKLLTFKNQPINNYVLNGTLVMEMVNNSFSESKKNFSRLIKRKKF